MTLSYNLISSRTYLIIHPFSTIFNPYIPRIILKAMPNDDIMTVKELADYLEIAEKTAYRFASEGKVPGFKVGSAWRFRKSEIDRWMSEQEQNSEDK